VPFAFAPASLACLVIALMMSPKYKGLYDVAAAVLAVGVVVGGIVAVVGENPLY
jgi:O-antigen/teichoic acid export membrane protein